MKRSARASACLLVATCALLTGGASAHASTYTLNLSAPSTGVAGQPIVIHASGVNPPPDQFWAFAWIQLVTIPATVMTTCPESVGDGLSVATGTGGQIVEIALRPNLDAAGNYDNLIGYTPPVPGRTLFCGYQSEGTGVTLARAALMLDVAAASTSPPGPAPAGPPASAPGPAAPADPAPATAVKPANVQRPRLTLSGGWLACAPGRWSNGDRGYRYGWLVGSRRVKGASGRRLRLRRGMRGRKVRCSVSATNAAGSTTAVSGPLRVR